MNSTRIEPRIRFLSNLREAHERSGLSYREVGVICDIDHSYVGRILNGARVPARDILINMLVFAYGLSRLETDELLVLVGYPPLGRSIRREPKSWMPESQAPSVEIQSENIF
jgi:transcriptional regulator with XRE-family HTH domain